MKHRKEDNFLEDYINFYELVGIWVEPLGWKDLADIKKERRALQKRPRILPIRKKKQIGWFPKSFVNFECIWVAKTELRTNLLCSERRGLMTSQISKFSKMEAVKFSKGNGVQRREGRDWQEIWIDQIQFSDQILSCF